MDWDNAANAWIAAQGDDGDFSRRYVLDAPMLARVAAARPDRLLDLGCGEGRFCRMVADHVPHVIGLDPAPSLIAHARQRGGAHFVEGRAEALPFDAAAFDMVVSYLSLLDIEGIETALDEVRRVLAPGGHFLVANLASFATASNITAGGWIRRADGAREMVVANYLQHVGVSFEHGGFSATNWHRPLSFYMQALLGRGFALRHFDEPAVTDPTHPKREAYNNAPYLFVMEWQLAA